MSSDQWIGSVGVALLLAGFALNLRGALSRESFAYQSINAVGASLACLASWMIAYYPFVVLEGFWAAVSFGALVKQFGTRLASRRNESRKRS